MRWLRFKTLKVLVLGVVSFCVLITLKRIMVPSLMLKEGFQQKLAILSTQHSHWSTPTTLSRTTVSKSIPHQTTPRSRELAINTTREITEECLPKFDPTHIKTSFKFYIYELPSMFNKDILKCIARKEHQYCYNLNFCGMGEELLRFTDKQLVKASTELLMKYSRQGYKYPLHQSEEMGNISENGNTRGGYSMSIRNTHQFALEAIIHYKLLHSPYRTFQPEKADIFYIPFYSGLLCLCDSSLDIKTPEVVEKLFTYMNMLPFFKSGKPHFSTLAKIQREQGSVSCPILTHQDSANITFIGIEKESNPSWTTYMRPHIYGKSILVAPYPAYVHLIDTVREPKLFEYDRKLENINTSQFRLSVPNLKERNVLLFLSCGERRSNGFRALLIDQFPVKTDEDYEGYFTRTNQTAVQQIMLITNECSVKHRYTTIPWMRRSIFCLQPPGDSPTRKSFYDSILSGCIPVIFKLKFPTEYPFSDKLNYSDFTYTIDEKLISRHNKSVLDIVKSIPREKVVSMHDRLIQVAKWFQYSVPDGGPSYDDDAVTMILDQLRRKHNLP